MKRHFLAEKVLQETKLGLELLESLAGERTPHREVTTRTQTVTEMFINLGVL